MEGVVTLAFSVSLREPGRVDARLVSQNNGMELTDFGLSIEGSSVVLVTVDGVNDVKTEVRVTRGGAISGRICYGRRARTTLRGCASANRPNSCVVFCS